MPFKILNFIDNLNDHTGKGLEERLLQNRVPYETLSTNNQTARWIGSLMDDLCVEIGNENAKSVMEACGQRCIGQSVLQKAFKLQQVSLDLDDLLGKLNQEHIGGGMLWREENMIHASYELCYCGSVSKTRKPISNIYCQCSCGWYKRLFETLLDKPVKVELLDSIIHGADNCQFIIHI
jgi:predicted hydrocarbon binding protein